MNNSMRGRVLNISLESLYGIVIQFTEGRVNINITLFLYVFSRKSAINEHDLDVVSYDSK